MASGGPKGQFDGFQNRAGWLFGWVSHEILARTWPLSAAFEGMMVNVLIHVEVTEVLELNSTVTPKVTKPALPDLPSNTYVGP